MNYLFLILTCYCSLLSFTNLFPVDKSEGGYADLLCIQQNRKQEGERMKKWAESMWRNRRLSLAEALEFSEPSKSAVVDTRICRVL